MLVAGFGFRKAVSVAEVECALAVALRKQQLTDAQLTRIAAPAAKAGEAAIERVAAQRGVLLAWICQAALETASPHTLTRSARALATLNVHSVAEAAALVGAGPHGRLLGPRIAVGPVTCALARGEDIS